jgi:hypothetical protein
MGFLWHIGSSTIKYIKTSDTLLRPFLYLLINLYQYTSALLQVYGELIYPVRKPGSGRPPNPRLVPAEDLLYVRVVEQ